MNREQIIRMAREAFDVEIDARGRETFSGDEYGIERFVALVIKSLKPSLQTEFEKMFMEGASAEREACAKLCEQHGYEHYCENVTDKLAKTIRARGQK